jgi:hypothetical protein
VAEAAELMKRFTALLFLYGQDLAPFRTYGWLPALRRACIKTILLWVKNWSYKCTGRNFTLPNFIFSTDDLARLLKAKKGSAQVRNQAFEETNCEV